MYNHCSVRHISRTRAAANVKRLQTGDITQTPIRDGTAIYVRPMPPSSTRDVEPAAARISVGINIFRHYYSVITNAYLQYTNREMYCKLARYYNVIMAYTM